MQKNELRKAQPASPSEKYADLYNAAPVAYFTLDEQDLILDHNPAGARLLGCEGENLLDHPITPHIAPKSRPTFLQHRQLTLETRRPQTCELRLRRRGRAPIYVQVHSAALQTGPGETRRWRSVMIDITERIHTENILRARLRITEFAAKHSLGELLQNALDELCALTDSPIGFFHYLEADQCTLSLQAWSTYTLKEMCNAEGQGQHYDVDQAGVWVDCIRERRPVIHNDYASLSHRKGLPEGHAPVNREMVFPIVRGEKIVAIIGVGNKPDDYTQDDIAYASRLTDLIWDITERKRAEDALQQANERLQNRLAQIQALQEQLQEQAVRDYLTGLFNRRYLQETLECEAARALRAGEPLGILIMDTDYFKDINDTYGHNAGDQALQAIGRLIKANIRAGDIPCRYGGEEFVVVMPGASLGTAQQRADFLLASIRELRIPVDGRQVQLTASIGVAAFPQHGAKGEDVLIRADRALYQAKENGRNQVVVYRGDGAKDE
ncbi:MAG: sensor domain-containing diguanylate cyclase [Chloroflexota bacterium]